MSHAPSSAPVRQPSQSATVTFDFGVQGMTCASCVSRVERAIRAVPGVQAATANLATERAHGTLARGSTDAAAVAQAIREIGYEPARHTIVLAIHGMTCASCVSRIERALGAVPGVVDVAVNLATERATVGVLAGAATAGQLIAAVKAAGYEAHMPEAERHHGEDEQAARAREIGALGRSVSIAIALTLPIFILEMGAHLVPGAHHWLDQTIGRQTLNVLFFVLASVVQFGPGLRFFQKGWPALVRGAPDMNALVMIGTSAAWSYSVVATFAPSLLPPGTAHIYFEASAVVVTLVLLGRYLEANAKGRTGDAIRRLISLEAKTARRLDNGRETEVAIEQVAVGDLLRVRPGEKVPVDGMIVEGHSYVDQSMITGEPVPALKEAGTEVIGGTINKTGSFTLRATRIGAETLLAQIVRMVEQAQGAKLPIQGLVDTVTGYFVPAVIGVAALTFAAWLAFAPGPSLGFALINAVAVLIIACPCAMGLATPTSIMVGTGRAAELGILFRKGIALQTLRAARIVAVDKTGTLTKGRPELTDMAVLPGVDETETLGLLAAVEARSEHPIAHAIVAAAEARGIALAEAADFTAVPGMGASATVAGRAVAVGAARYMAKLGIAVEPFAERARSLADDGKTPLYAANDGRLAAIVAVADPIKPTTPAALEALHKRGLKVAMLTGDAERTAAAIARNLGIDQVIAELMPEAKVAAIKRLQQGGEKVAFVGDGINDAPALAQADVGVAIGTGTDIAIESADVVLMSGDLRNVVNAIALSDATMRNIKQNLFWAFAYNVLLIPVAAGALYPAFGVLLSPVFAALAMAASSVCVVGNALRLKRFAPPLAAEVGTRPGAASTALDGQPVRRAS